MPIIWGNICVVQAQPSREPSIYVVCNILTAVNDLHKTQPSIIASILTFLYCYNHHWVQFYYLWQKQGRPKGSLYQAQPIPQAFMPSHPVYFLNLYLQCVWGCKLCPKGRSHIILFYCQNDFVKIASLHMVQLQHL